MPGNFGRTILHFLSVQRQDIKFIISGKSLRPLQSSGVAGLTPLLVPTNVFLICMFIGQEWAAGSSGPA